ncbi:hypothetical protein Vadar_011742 [Vaccinium darrowii]|uniref:Uncharacterized protein n=1 Tax=Vaccinium darrowii TaxID=229202 RepID=A0ACB7YDD1_9ERIC|nr:hypothetical protein Vadar_011742 [Vaccinium darrowii]
MVGIEGIVGMLGREVAGSGGRVILGTVGMVGNVGFGRVDEIWVVGIGAIVGFGKVGIVGRGVVGSGGIVVWETVGMAGNGGIVTLGIDGTAGICRRWRAARVTWMLERDNARIRGRTTAG